MKKFVRMVVLFLCVCLLSINAITLSSCGDDNSNKKDNEYGYVTRSDGTRKWYHKDSAYRVD